MDQNIYHLIEMFFWMLGAFIIGLIFGRILPKKIDSKTNQLDDYYHEEIIEEDFSKIRATKTFERGGKESVLQDNVAERKLNFERIGIGSLSNKDDLHLLKGIGSVAEKKLNDLGIFNYEQLSNLTANDVEFIATAIHFSVQRIEKDNWIGQAKEQLSKS